MKAKAVDCNTKYVLIVDDDQALLEMLAEQVEAFNATAVCATSVDDALGMLGFCRFDLVISDYNMPEKNGLEFFRTLKRWHPTIPFYFCSCLLPDAAEKLVRDGKAGKLTKPIIQGELKELFANG